MTGPACRRELQTCIGREVVLQARVQRPIASRCTVGQPCQVDADFAHPLELLVLTPALRVALVKRRRRLSGRSAAVCGCKSLGRQAAYAIAGGGVTGGASSPAVAGRIPAPAAAITCFLASRTEGYCGACTHRRSSIALEARALRSRPRPTPQRQQGRFFGAATLPHSLPAAGGVLPPHPIRTAGFPAGRPRAFRAIVRRILTAATACRVRFPPFTTAAAYFAQQRCARCSGVFRFDRRD
mmetsp:Transcript_54948/g.114972  ORF Transcript_54948/g.114972 Transcript_54948/m.114972 type:complete len:240 (-) Transcript_54948:2440-3159(-)